MSGKRTNSIEIVLNGERKSVRPELTLVELLQELEIDPARVAVELDRFIVRAPEWAQTRLHDGAEVEIVQFVGGG
ncbi:MAG: sulfur carrier protein ThiS [Bryobacteraceae bacterium]|nr:sulfur carrier protein ThiS [Bryobacterales bacterium]MEB2361509.1 sulfur carrier protein ThiS [Bryobacterales bacterium]NUN01713.1 sulfur carrier protein ThiS [Bryobacteraceae bacterium]